MTINRRNLSGAVLAALLVLGAAGHATAETLDGAMDKLAVQVQRQMAKADASSVQLGRPDGPPGDAAMLRMQQALTDALTARGINVSARATFKLSTEYLRDPNSNKYSMNVRLKDASGQTIGSLPANFEFQLTDPADQAVLAGATVEPATDPVTGAAQPATIERIGQALAKEGGATVAGPDKSLVGALPKSKFHIELLVKPKNVAGEYLPRIAEIDPLGRAFCGLKAGEVYAVRIVNDADHAVAVDLSIDGINVWRLSNNPVWRRHGKLHVPARDTVTLYGWHLEGNDYGEFEVVDLPQGIAARLGGAPDRVGQVTALFYAAWSEGDAPIVEPIGAAGPKTDVGRRTRRDTETVRCFFGTSLLGAVTVRYAR